MENSKISGAMTIKLDAVLPEYPKFEEGKRRAPDRGFRLTQDKALPFPRPDRLREDPDRVIH